MSFLKALLPFAALGLLSACGPSGGGGGGGGGTPPPSWVYGDEYNNNNSLTLVKARALYEDGGTGADIVVAVIDTGIDVDHSEFDGRIHNASADIRCGDKNIFQRLSNLECTIGTRNSRINDGSYSQGGQGHGTWVSGVIAANYDDNSDSGGIHGIAYEAQIMAIDASDERFYVEDGVGYFDNNRNENNTDAAFWSADTAASIKYAVDQGAHVINMSLGGSYLTPVELEALEYATDNGVAVVMSAGNNDEQPAGAPAVFAGMTSAHGLALAVTSPGTDGQSDSSFSSTCTFDSSRLDYVTASTSNNQDNFQAYCLAAPGQSVRTTDVGGGYATVSGTSFSAPNVSGAIALLLEMFGSNSVDAADVIAKILETADKTQLVGYSEGKYGQGMLDLTAAAEAYGLTTTTAGVASTATNDAFIATSAAFGDAFINSEALKHVVVYDEFNFEYIHDLTGQVGTSRQPIGLSAFNSFDDGSVVSGSNNVTLDRLAFDMGYSQSYDAEGELETSALNGYRIGYQISDDQTLAFANGSHASTGAMFDFIGSANQSFGMTDSAMAPFSKLTNGGSSMIYQHKMKDWTVSYTIAMNGDEASSATNFAATAQRHFKNGLRLGAQFSAIYEDNQLLGSTAQGAYNADFKATTYNASAGLAYAFGKTELFGQYTLGTTTVLDSGAGLVTNFSEIGTESAMIGLSRQNLFLANDRVNLMISRPLRTTSGTAEIGVAVLDGTEELIDLTPSGAQTNFELSYMLPIDQHSELGFGLAYITNPDHVADAPDAYALGVRYLAKF